jgi:hypothetical protein
MSQDLYFYQFSWYSDKFIDLPRENIFESVKALFKGSDRTSQNIDDMIQQYFGKLDLDFLEITYEDIQQIDSNFEQKQQFLFDKRKHSFFFIDECCWKNLESITDNKIKSIYDEGKYELHERLKEVSEISKDYNHLKQYFDNKILFAQIV